MPNYIVDGSDLSSIADTIRTKGGTSLSLRFPDGFISAINAIDGGGGADVPTGCEIGTFQTNADENTVTISHNLGQVPKFAICLAVPNAAWGSIVPSTILAEILMSDPETGIFDRTAASGHYHNDVIIANGTTTQQTGTYTTYPADMTSSSVTFATGRYYGGKFKGGVKYIYVLTT